MGDTSNRRISGRDNPGFTNDTDKKMVRLDNVSETELNNFATKPGKDKPVENFDETDSGKDKVDTGFTDIKDSTVSNIYIGKRNFIHQLMDVALLMANVSQLKALLVSHNNYFYLLLTFICLSISLQVVFTLCMLLIWSLERKIEHKDTEKLSPNEEHQRVWADRLDKVGNVLVLFIIVSNVFVAGFGVESWNEESTDAGSAVGGQFKVGNRTETD